MSGGRITAAGHIAGFQTDPALAPPSERADKRRVVSSGRRARRERVFARGALFDRPGHRYKNGVIQVNTVRIRHAGDIVSDRAAHAFPLRYEPVLLRHS